MNDVAKKAILDVIKDIDNRRDYHNRRADYHRDGAERLLVKRVALLDLVNTLNGDLILTPDGGEED